MRVIEPLLKVEDVMKIFGTSKVTIYRWVNEARAGKSRFPAPLNGYKRRLLWSADTIARFCESQAVAQPPVSVPSPSKQAKSVQERRAHTETILAGHGIKLSSSK